MHDKGACVASTWGSIDLRVHPMSNPKMKAVVEALHHHLLLPE